MCNVTLWFPAYLPQDLFNDDEMGDPEEESTSPLHFASQLLDSLSTSLPNIQGCAATHFIFCVEIFLACCLVVSCLFNDAGAEQLRTFLLSIAAGTYVCSTL